MTLRPSLRAWISATLLALGSLSCGAADADSAGMAMATGGTCATASCLSDSDWAGSAPLVAEVDRPTESAAGAAAVDAETPLLALCGTGCGADEAGQPLLPEDPAACVGRVAQGGQAGADDDAARLGCSIAAGEDGEPTGECVARGEGELGAPCIKQADCAPGFACVGEDGAGQCRTYCCADPESCPVGTFCAARKLFDRDQDPIVAPLQVPVCAEAHECRLDEPFPCPADQTCTCASGTACTVVRSDGTTGCVPAPSPGGVEGEACPCSPATVTGPGFICSQTTHTCLALCVLGPDVSSCGAGRRCQSSASLPDGFGICTSAVSNGSDG